MHWAEAGAGVWLTLPDDSESEKRQHEQNKAGLIRSDIQNKQKNRNKLNQNKKIQPSH